MPRIFGLDIGTTSIGFAVIDQGPEIGGILQLGVRIFPEARDPDGTPLNQERRTKRMVRRQLRRRRARRRALNECLAEAGLLPPFASKDWPKVMGDDPVKLRSRGLLERLEPFELGRALYHLAQLRHFKGRDLGDDDEAEGADEQKAKDEKKARSERDQAVDRRRKSGETLLQELAGKGPHDRRRGTHATRAEVQAEFDRLWAAQEKHHPALCETGFRERVADTIFAQRPVFWRRNTLGDCRFMPGEEPCPKGTWLSQQRRMLEKLNNLAISGGNGRPLDADEREAILAVLQGQASMSWPAVRGALKPIFKARGEAGREKSLRFNLEEGGDKALLGNGIEARLAKIFGAAWADHLQLQVIRDTVPRLLWDADYGRIGTQRVVILSEDERKRHRSEAAARFVADFSASPAQAAALAELKLPTGWEPYSTAALEKFMPHLEEGVRFGALVNGPEWAAWRAETFPNRVQPTGEILDRLPSPANKEERERVAALRNPTVVRTQNELRKVVNNLIGLYGKPDLIRVELAREVGLSKRKREERQNGMKLQEKRRKDAKKDLQANHIAEPSRDDIQKWMLWKESSERCPYTGDQICFDALFGRDEYEVEHIWPRSRSLDDGFRNKTLCRKDVNIAKGKRTPFEAFGGDADRWDAICNRLDKLEAKKGGPGMPRGKIKRFLAEAIPEDFTARQLVDTGFAAREAIGFLRRLWPDVGPTAPVNVQAVTGRVTDQLRRLWGLNNILADDGEKTRADHRHHAIDALAIACAHPGVTNKLSRYWQERENSAAARPRLDPPWAQIRDDAARAVDEDAALAENRSVVSHRVRKKVSGSLHKEMPLGYTKEDTVKRGTTYGIYVKRMPVEKLSLETLKIANVDEITKTAKVVVRDPGLRRVLAAHLEAAGGKPEKAYPPYPRVSADGPEIRKVRVLSIQQKELMVPVANGFVDPANNHHVAVYRSADGKIEYEVVTLFESSRRLAKREPVVRRKRDDDAAFVMSLSSGEALRFSAGDKAGVWIVSGVWSAGPVVLERAGDADHATTWRPVPGAILKAGGEKIAIDPIGRIRPAAD
jgi:CRISPR-associated endonuclease Csn1